MVSLYSLKYVAMIFLKCGGFSQKNIFFKIIQDGRGASRSSDQTNLKILPKIFFPKRATF
jgi:hypothetical protein